MRLLISRFRKLLDFATVSSAEFRELNTKLINPKECLDFLSRRCYGSGAGEGRSREGEQQSIPILECASLEDAAPHLCVVAGSHNVHIYEYTHTISQILPRRRAGAQMHVYSPRISDIRARVA